MPDNFLSPLFIFLTQFLTSFLTIFFPGNVLYHCHLCQSVEETPALNSNDEQRYFFETLVLALYFFNLRKYFHAIGRSMLNCQRIHFMSSKKMHFLSFFFWAGGRGEFSKHCQNRSCLDCLR